MLRIIAILTFSFVLIRCGNEENNNGSKGDATQNSIPETKSISYSVLNAYVHDTAAFTQGLELYKGQLYESTGLQNRSSLRKVDLKSGQVLLKKAIDTPYFAEGITILNDTIYQLTWSNKIVFLYRLKDMAPIGKINWNGEGWGITNDGKNLYISDGSDKIYIVRPGDLKLQRILSVQDNSGPVNNLNELEYINGHIFANRWQYNYIVQINPSTGQVTGKLDMTDFLSKNSKTDITYLTRPGSTGDQMGGVLNGIAWDSASGRMLVTGKLWPYIFELKVNK
jgi:glutaminyl-peptide cyclotransferase